MCANSTGLSELHHQLLRLRERSFRARYTHIRRERHIIIFLALRREHHLAPTDRLGLHDEAYNINTVPGWSVKRQAASLCLKPWCASCRLWYIASSFAHFMYYTIVSSSTTFGQLSKFHPTRASQAFLQPTNTLGTLSQRLPFAHKGR